MPKPEPSKTRQHEHEFEINASPEVVWKAITDAQELVNWFPLAASAEPGEGGQITYEWGDLKGSCRIHVWEPGKHLQTSWLAETPPGGAQVVVDWFLEGDGGRTRLRLVHSGFGTGPEWDNEFEGTRAGWEFELFSLKHYLEYHRGRRRTAFWLRRPVQLEPAEVWKRLFGPTGVLSLPEPAALQPGQRVQLAVAGTERIDAAVIHCLPPTELAWTAVNFNRGLMRAGFENCGAGPEAHIWLSLWDVPQEQAEQLRQRLDEALAAALRS